MWTVPQSPALRRQHYHGKREQSGARTDAD